VKIGTTCYILLFTFYFSSANVWQGDYLIQSQDDADSFRSICNCALIDGNLMITGNDIVHLDSLSDLKEVTTSLEIMDNPLLNNLSGLQNLLIVGRNLKIHKNSSLKNLAGFENLQFIRGSYFNIKYNENLIDIKGFNNLLEVANINIEKNPRLKEFILFENLQYFQQLLIWRNDSLTTIREEDALTQMGRFSVHRNNNLQQIDGFNKVTSVESSIEITENPSLKIISAFKNLKKIDSDFDVYENDQLIEVNGFNQLEFVGGSLTLKLPLAIISEPHFQNLTIVEEYFNTNISNFNKLDSVGKIYFGQDQTSIDTLYGSSSIKKIGTLEIVDNNQLKFIHGFSELRHVVDFQVRNNPNLKQIEGFKILDSIGSSQIDSGHFVIQNNASLNTIKGFDQLKKIAGSFSCTLNEQLTNITAFNQIEEIAGNCTIDLPIAFTQQNIFSNLKAVEGKLITNATNFRTLENVGFLLIRDDIINTDTLNGFSTLKKVGTLSIRTNEKLKHIAAFRGLEVASVQIDSNKNLISIAGFDKLQTIENLQIAFQPSLKEITAFKNLHTSTGSFAFLNNHAITDISFLNQLKSIESLFISSNNNLIDISGFRNLSFANNFTIADNPNIENLSTSFRNLTKVGERLSIRRNPQLRQVPELNNLANITSIAITGNVNLQKIKGFESLEEVLEIDISSNNNLLSIDGFNRVSNLLGLNIENRNLRNVDAFTQLKVLDDLTLTNNIQLKSIDNFSSIRFIANQLVLISNLQLNNCCLVNCWLNNGVVDELSINIGNNGMNCTSLQSIKMSCEDDSCQINELGLSDLEANSPAREQLQFSFINFEEQIVNYTIYNINEQLIRKGSATGNKGFNLKTIDLPEVERGYYFLQIKGKDTEEVVKFLKL